MEVYSKVRAGVMILCCGETAWPRNASLHGGMGGTGKDGIIQEITRQREEYENASFLNYATQPPSILLSQFLGGPWKLV